MAFTPEQIAAEIAENKAQKVSLTQNKSTFEREFTRIWKPAAGALSAQVEAALNAIITVTTPKYENGTKELPGLWRVAASGWNPQGQTYFQTLREGWASTVLNGSLPDDEWMIQTGSDTRSDARSFTFLRRNVASTAINSEVTALRTLGAWAGPTIQGEVKTGTYAFANIVPMQQADGSYWITVEAFKCAAITEIANFSGFTPLRQVLRNVSIPFGRGGGYDSHLERSFDRVLKLTYEHVTSASRTYLESLTGTEIQPILGSGWEFVNSNVESDGAGAVNFVIIGKLVSRRAWTTPVPTCDLLKWPSTGTMSRASFTREWLSYRNADHDTIMTALLPGGSISNVNDAGYQVTSVIPSDNGDGSTDYTQTMTSIYNLSWPDVEPRFCMLMSGQEKEYRAMPSDSTRVYSQYRFHYLTMERCYTNTKAIAEAWAGKAVITTSPKGDTGDTAALYGSWKEREKGSTRYVAYRITVDYYTAWAEAMTSTPGDGI